MFSDEDDDRRGANKWASLITHQLKLTSTSTELSIEASEARTIK